MRPRAEFAMMHGGAMAPTAAPGGQALTTGTHSPWQSPVPYLFGGLAAMLGLIAFAMLILACSYWKLSGYLDGGSHGSARAGAGEGDDDGEKGSVGGAARPAAAVQEHVVVIMAGEERPTFLAMPSASHAAVELGAMANPAAAASALGGDGAQELENKIDDSPQLVGGGSGSESSGATSTALQENSQ